MSPNRVSSKAATAVSLPNRRKRESGAQNPPDEPNGSLPRRRELLRLHRQAVLRAQSEVSRRLTHPEASRSDSASTTSSTRKPNKSKCSTAPGSASSSIPLSTATPPPSSRTGKRAAARPIRTLSAHTASLASRTASLAKRTSPIKPTACSLAASAICGRR